MSKMYRVGILITSSEKCLCILTPLCCVIKVRGINLSLVFLVDLLLIKRLVDSLGMVWT